MDLPTQLIGGMLETFLIITIGISLLNVSYKNKFFSLLLISLYGSIVLYLVKSSFLLLCCTFPLWFWRSVYRFRFFEPQNSVIDNRRFIGCCLFTRIRSDWLRNVKSCRASSQCKRGKPWYGIAPFLYPFIHAFPNSKKESGFNFTEETGERLGHKIVHDFDTVIFFAASILFHHL